MSKLTMLKVMSKEIESAINSQDAIKIIGVVAASINALIDITIEEEENFQEFDKLDCDCEDCIASRSSKEIIIDAFISRKENPKKVDPRDN